MLSAGLPPLDDVVEEYEERAAIAEYCGELSRRDAQRLAVRRLRAKYGPDVVTYLRFRVEVDSQFW